MMAKRKKDKYYLKRLDGGMLGDDMHAIHQASNNVIVAWFYSSEMAQLVMDFLNELPRSLLPIAKSEGYYKRLERMRQEAKNTK